jgi:hypothetical protein
MLFFPGLSLGQNSPLLGKWLHQSDEGSFVLQFNADGSGSFDEETIQYKMDGSKAVWISWAGYTLRYQFEINQNSLLFWGGELDAKVLFTRLETVNSTISPSDQPLKRDTAHSIPVNEPAGLVGEWTGNKEVLQFGADGYCVFQGLRLKYRLDKAQLLISLPQGGELPMGYTLHNHQLTLIINQKSLVYYRKGHEPTVNAAELAGNWCYVSSQQLISNSGGGTGGSSRSRCIVLQADGSYTYTAESSMSTQTDAYWGATNSSENDSGQWWLEGNQLHYRSAVSGKTGAFTLEKRNHPHNNDPMLVLDGEAYVTQYQKAPW